MPRSIAMVLFLGGCAAQGSYRQFGGAFEGDGGTPLLVMSVTQWRERGRASGRERGRERLVSKN